MKDIPWKGRELVAKQDLDSGTMVFEDRAHFAPDKTLQAETLAAWERECEIKRELEDCKHWEWSWSLDFADPHNAFAEIEPIHELGVWKTKCVPTKDAKITVFRLLSFVNHSCVHSAVYSYNAETQSAQLHLVCNLSAGDEITHDYTAFSEQNRYDDMKQRFSFDYSCCLCGQKNSILDPNNNLTSFDEAEDKMQVRPASTSATPEISAHRLEISLITEK